MLRTNITPREREGIPKGLVPWAAGGTSPFSLLAAQSLLRLLPFPAPTQRIMEAAAPVFDKGLLGSDGGAGHKLRVLKMSEGILRLRQAGAAEILRLEQSGISGRTRAEERAPCLRSDEAQSVS